MSELTLGFAFIAGLISFISPCVLPLIPAFLSYLSGVSAEDLKKNKQGARFRIFINSVFFVLGFAFVFSVLGVLINSVLSDSGYDIKIWAGRIGGILIFLFGLRLVVDFVLLKMGKNSLKIPFIDSEHKFHGRKFGSAYLTSFVFGATFAAGWTPCVGAILGAIFTLAISDPGSAFYLLLSYSLGLGIPFLLVGLFTERFQRIIAKSDVVLSYFNLFTGLLLIILGILVFTGSLSRLANIPALTEFLIRLGL